MAMQILIVKGIANANTTFYSRVCFVEGLKQREGNSDVVAICHEAEAYLGMNVPTELSSVR
jgi:hypothetical protein